jgi:hypothetical protein
MTTLRGTLRELVVTMLWLAWLTTAHAETKIASLQSPAC